MGITIVLFLTKDSLAEQYENKYFQVFVVTCILNRIIYSSFLGDLSCLPLKNSFFVGDSYTDLQCAVNFGLTPILVRSGKGSITESRLRQERENEALKAELSDSPNKNFYLHQTKTYNDLAHFSRIILS